jgi:hypothetical protein
MFEEKNSLIGLLFASMHTIFIFLTLWILLFSQNIGILITIGIILLIILYLNHVYGDCPITYIEDYHLGNTMADFTNSHYPIKYNKKRRPEVTLQWIFMGLLMIVVKILTFFVCHTLKEMKLI